MRSIEDVLGKDYVQKALDSGTPTTLLEGEALSKAGVDPGVLNEDQLFALQKYKQATEGKLQTPSEKIAPSKDWKDEARNFLNDNSFGRGLGSLVSRYALTANALSGNTLLNNTERNNIAKYQEMIEKKKEEKNASFLSPERKKAIEDLKSRSQNAQGFAENFKMGVQNVFDTLTHPKEWTIEGIVDNVADPINLVGFGVGNIASKTVSKIAPKIANSLASKMAIGGVAGSIEGGGVNALQGLGEELGKGKTLQQATKSATQALAGGVLAGGVLGSAGGGVAHIGTGKNNGDFMPSVGFNVKDRPQYSELSDSEKENIKNEILNNELLKNQADPIVSTKIKDNASTLHQKSIESLKDSIEDLSLAEKEAQNINQQAKDLARSGVKDLDVLQTSDRLKGYTRIINDGNSVLDPRLEGTGILHTLKDNIQNPLLSSDEFFNKLKQKGVVDELAKITTEAYAQKNSNILQNYIEAKLTQATEAKIALDLQNHIQNIPSKDLGKIVKNSVVVDDRAGVNEPVVYKIIPKSELKPMFKPGEGTQHRFADNTSMISSIINNFNPDLHFGREGGFDGVPIVDYDGHIVTGNHRASAISTMYSTNKAEPYIEGIKKYYGDDVLEGIKDPVLVRELLTRNDEKIQRIAKVSNEGRENSIADSLITNGAKIQPFIDRLPPIINNNFELANYLHIQGMNDQSTAQGLLSVINPKIAHYVDAYLKNKKNDPRIFNILIDNAFLFWNAKTYAKAPNMEGVDISNLLDRAIERLSVQKEPTAKKELERVLDHYEDAFLSNPGAKKFSELANIEDLKGELLGILLYSLTGRKDGGKEAFRDRFERAIASAKGNSKLSLFNKETGVDPKQTQWNMLSYLFDTSKEDITNDDFSSNLLNSKYELKLRDLIDKEKNNDSTIHMERDLPDTESIHPNQSQSEPMGGTTLSTTSGSFRSAHRQGGRSDLQESRGATDNTEVPPSAHREISKSLSEAPPLEHRLGDDPLSSREGDDRTLSSRESSTISSDGAFMRGSDRDGKGSGEGLQRVLDTGGNGEPHSGHNGTKQRRGTRTLSDSQKSHTLDRTRDFGIQTENGDSATRGGGHGSPLHQSVSVLEDRLSSHLKTFYDKYEITKTQPYQEAIEVQKSSLVTGLTPRLTPGYADKIMSKAPLELAFHNNWVKEKLKEPFGIDFQESFFKKIKGKQALQTLLTYKLGQVKGAFHKEGLGDIDLIWGEVTNAEKHTGYGLAHIIDKHPEVVDKIPEIINNGELKSTNGVSTIILKSEDGNYRIGLSKGWYDKGENNWILTAYQIDKSPHPVVRPSNGVASRDGTDLPSNDYEKEGDKSLYTSLSPLKRDEILSHSSLSDSTTQKQKNQELQDKNEMLKDEIEETALDLINQSHPTQDTQPYLPLVESVEKRVLQKKAEAKKNVIYNDLEDIKKDLPYLLDAQAEDVKFAEQRFSTGGRGVLFTNGTGTGKTFTGLGIAKRKLKMGAKNILILTQSTQKNLDWKKEGKILNIDITEVNNTKDNPKGTIVATYANFRENEGLNSRTYDLIIYDESQSILGSKQGSITEVFQQHQNISIWNYLEPDAPRNDENFHKANELAKNNQVVFLSATPFAAHKTLKYGEGLLFENRVDNQFLMDNFGYTMRYSKLTYPQRGVDVGQLERDFADRMAKNGVSRGRRLMSDYDYNRAFMKVDGGLGKEIDKALDILGESGVKSDERRYFDLYHHYRKKFNYHYVNKISESIKAKETLGFVKDNLKDGRKVVIFHSYNEGGVPHPFIENFDIKEQASLYAQYELFKKEYPQYFEEMDFENPLELYKKEFGNQVEFYNGRVSKKNRSKAIDLFNDDESHTKVLVVQIDAGGTGISLHDKTGKYPRIALKLNIPTKPITEIQSEGRVYRTGQKSNTAYVYAVTHLGIEQRVFGSSINERIGTVENLALGSEARNLKDTFKQGYLDAKELTSKTLELTGGKDYDRMVEKLEPYAKSINDYFSHKSNKYDGVDFFPTPEPIGFKMSRWADVLDGESILEPSAGSGSIARYFTEGAKATAIEPSSKLFSKLQVNISSENPRLLNKNFEDLNIREKFDGIVMNPPFGNNSITALAHLKKALGHLNSEGRVVALVPSGNSMMKHLENLDDFAKDIKKNPDESFKLIAEISLPQVTFKRAGTNVNTKILVIDKTKNEVAPEVYDFSHIDKIEKLFEEIGNIELPKRERIEKTEYNEPLSYLLHNGILKTNEQKLSVRATDSIERSRFQEIWKVAKELGGEYLKGKFVFPDNESFKKFIESEDC